MKKMKFAKHEIMKLNTLVLLISVLVIFSSFTNNDPVSNNFHLFKIERSKDANEIFYDLNISSSNKLNTENPINIYWIRHTDNGHIEPLTWIQKNYAYGVTYLTKTDQEASFHFVSYSKRSFQIKKDSNGVFRVFTLSKNTEVKVNRIFIQIDGGTFWLPKISRVELHAQDVKTHEKTIEMIKP